MVASVENKVIVVTGGGRGIGRAIARYAAGHGAKVVVNDLGVHTNGSAAAQDPAAEVVREIREAGGDAIWNNDNIADHAGAERIIQAAIETFGRVDCVVNNAGIVRDRMFHNMSDEEWDAVLKVHLYGYFNVSRAAAPHFKTQGGGSYVHFTSPSALFGNLGQANYAAAKMGVVGLSTGISLDMARYNVRSNCIAPSAWSRLLADVPVRSKEDEERNAKLQQTMTAEQIAPLTVYLASDAARDITGQIFKIRGNEVFLMSQPRPLRSVHRHGGWNLDTINEHLVPSLRDSFVKVQSHLDFFTWDPI